MRSGTPLGDELVDLRESFLSASAVRDAYLGFAVEQARRGVAARRVHPAPSNLPRVEKHARHLFRVLRQGTELYCTGRLRVRLDSAEADACRTFGVIAARDWSAANALLADARETFAPCARPRCPSTRTTPRPRRGSLLSEQLITMRQYDRRADLEDLLEVRGRAGRAGRERA
jgi:hypothetical protein